MKSIKNKKMVYFVSDEIINRAGLTGKEFAERIESNESFVKELENTCKVIVSKSSHEPVNITPEEAEKEFLRLMRERGAIAEV